MGLSVKRWPSFLGGDLVVIWALIALAWVAMVVATITRQDHWLHHHALIEQNSQPLLIKLPIFLAAWQVMMVAMMVPTTLPLLRQIGQRSGATGQLTKPGQRRLISLGMFLLAYLFIWTGFALVVFLGDLGLHRLSHALPWLEERPWLITGTTLLLIGAFQFAPLKRQCMHRCCHPAQFLTQHPDAGPQASWSLGIDHGLNCLGCCGGLMLGMFAVGVGHLFWMLVLTVIMVLEKTSRWNRAIATTVGLGFLAWGGLTLIQPFFSSAAPPTEPPHPHHQHSH